MCQPKPASIVLAIVGLLLVAATGCFDSSKLAGPLGPLTDAAPVPEADRGVGPNPDFPRATDSAPPVADTSQPPADAPLPAADVPVSLEPDAAHSLDSAPPLPDVQDVDTTTPAGAAALAWVGDFSTGDLSQFKTHYEAGGYCEVVTSPVRDGRYAARSVTPTPSVGVNTRRAELITKLGKDSVFPNAGGKMTFAWDGPEYWLGFSVYFKQWAAGANTFVQLHSPNPPANWYEPPPDCVECRGDCGFDGNAFSLTPTGDGGLDANGKKIEDQLTATVVDNPTGRSSNRGAGSNTKPVWAQPFSPNNIGVWIDFVFRFHLSKKGEGYYQLWRNGVLVAEEYDMYNVNWIDSCGNLIPDDQLKHNGVKIGVYAGGDQFREMFFDEVRLAVGPNGYDVVAPGGRAGGAPKFPRKP